MVSLHLKKVSVDFPLYGLRGRSLKQSLLRIGSGNRIGRDSKDRIVIRALHRISLQFEKGDRVGLIGSNGAGKTTLLRVLAGIYEPTSGTLRVDGHVTSMLNIRLGIDQEATGYENIYLRGLAMGMTPEEIRQRTAEIAAFTELGNHLNLPLHTYSTGMRMRLAFAVATAVEPDILLMDEWIGAGDASFTEKASKRMNELVERSGILVLASHNASLIERTCNKVVLLDQGKVAAFGPVSEIMPAYRKAS
ncbi:ABC transporter ATP-binding protein [Rhodospirillaceae bacterium SYSU D60014]|uniref:ABC transporter ATP-binding protein n=1 Tax=Virgifigura deserti TaxID=2268457 RepID=UPI000E6717E8